MNSAPPTYSRSTLIRFTLRQDLTFRLYTRLKQPIAYTLVLAGFLLRILGMRRRALDFILKGRRIGTVPAATSMLGGLLSGSKSGVQEIVSILGPPPTHAAADLANRVLILKTPSISPTGVIERGAVIVKFTETFSPFLQLLETKLLTKYFQIVLEPSWVGYSLPDILAYAQLRPEPVVVFSPYDDDYSLLHDIHSNLVPVTLGPADWANSARFYPLPHEPKLYDSIYVANYNPIKRVDRYLRAVAKVSQRRAEFTAALVCATHGTARREVHETLAWARKHARIDFFDGVSQEQLNVLINQSKVNVLLSLREGSNKGLAEGMFAGTPVLLLKESVCGNHRHINASTGKVVADRELEDALSWFSDHHREFSPRVWAEQHISAEASTRALSRTLREIEREAGRPWTTGLRAKVNQPEMRYLNAIDNWLLGERAGLLSAFSKGAKESDAVAVIQRLSRLEEQFGAPDPARTDALNVACRPGN